MASARTIFQRPPADVRGVSRVGLTLRVFTKLDCCVAASSIALALCVAWGPAAADPEATDEGSELNLLAEIPSVFGASKHEQKITDAPSTVTIVTAEEIRKLGCRTLADILNTATGLYVTYDRNYSYLGVRGFNPPGDSNSRILLLVDGHRITENVYDSSYLGSDFLLDVSMIDRVEVIRGPGSALYGSNAFFAVINVITARALSVNGVQAAAELGSFATYLARFAVGHSFENGTESLVAGSVHESQGDRSLYFKEFDSPETNSGVAERLDGELAYRLLTTITLREFTFQGTFNWRKKRFPTASFGTVFNDSRTWTVDSLAYLDIKYERRIDNGFGVVARASYNRYKYDGSYPYDLNERPDPQRIAINKDDVLGQWLGGEVEVSKTVWGQQRLTAGAEYRQNTDQNIKNFDLDPRSVYTDLSHRSRTWGVFAQGEFHGGPKLLLNLGLRYDNYETFGGTTNPRVAAIYHPTQRSTLKAMYGRAFRAPNVWEAFNTDPVSKPNPNLRPETIRTYELAYEQQMPQSFSLKASTYYNHIEGLISQVTDPTDELLINRNVDDVRARGLEVELARQPRSGLSGRVSYAVQRISEVGTGDELDNSPRHLAKASLIVPLFNASVFASMNMRYSSAVRTLAGGRAPAYWPIDVTVLCRRWSPHLELSGSIYNLLDQTYGFPGATQHAQDVILQDGRTFRVRLGVSF